MRDYLLVTRSVDPVQLERERMDHMSRGFAGTAEGSVLTTMAYVSFQELATRISHRNTGTHTDDEGCDRLLARIAADENLHMLFYRNVVGRGLRARPRRRRCRPSLDVVENFQMPGNEVEGFTRRSVAIALAGIYDLRIHHDEVLSPVLRAWNVFDRTDFGPDGEDARDAPRAVHGRPRRRRDAVRGEARREGRPARSPASSRSGAPPRRPGRPAVGHAGGGPAGARRTKINILHAGV